MQISIANHLPNEIRRQHGDGILVEGWALYGEEMLMRRGLYPENSPGQGQILRLSRYRAARIGVDVNLHTGKWTFDQAVNYFMEAGGLDRESGLREPQAPRQAPTRSRTWWEVAVMRLLESIAKARRKLSLGQFHDDLIRNGRCRCRY